MSGSQSTENLATYVPEPGVQVGDTDVAMTFTDGDGSTGNTVKTPGSSTFTQFAALSNMSTAGFVRVRIVTAAGVLVKKARIPLLTDA